ncbi:MAG: A/G-specific adenine glycosylase [Bryobacterales bacterium]|nr:A/G-specific adenine glycosylase [Bryobacterales bacterium]
MEKVPAFRNALLTWYRRAKRDLPWRRTGDAYSIWISEIMLQQTRVVAVIPYYERFLNAFPGFASLAQAPEEKLLQLWAGLGYYSRARNLQKAARQMVELGGIPRDYNALRQLAGIGDYTAAAIASIAFDLPHAVLDGNVLRVLARLNNDPSDIADSATRKRMQGAAQNLLDPKHPGEFNQAMMELGATVCLPRKPQCGACPVRTSCAARLAGRENELPVKLRKMSTVRVDRTLLLVRNGDRVLAWRRGEESSQLRGFWELPEPEHLPEAQIVTRVGEFRHSITNHVYRFEVAEARIFRKPKSFQYVSLSQDGDHPLSTTTRKALACLKKWKKSFSGS